MKCMRSMRRQRAGQRGAYAVPFAILPIPLIGFIGMACPARPAASACRTRQ